MHIAQTAKGETYVTDLKPGEESPIDARIDGRTAAAIHLGSARVLVVDRDVMSHRVVASILEQGGYDTVVETLGENVFQALEAHAIDVVVLDMGVPGGGVELMRRIHKDRRYVELPVLMLSSPTLQDAAMAALGSGADDVVMKPVDPHVLLARIRAALRTRRALLGMEAAHQVIATLARELNARDTDIQRHTERIGKYASELGHRVSLSTADLHAVAYSILLHDLGRIGISESILLKQGPLSDDERETIRGHTEIGERIAAPLQGAERLGPIIRHHHERWDGKGYPDGLSGGTIPMGARIISIVDAFDAMTQYRPYREARSITEAIAELRRERAQQFDPRLVDEFVRVLEWDGVG
jgi:putative two-component system response regulator